MVMENADCIASVFFGILDPCKRLLTFSNAGHPPALLRRADRSLEELFTGDPLLGVQHAARTSHAVSTVNASAIVCYTDGLIEASRNLFEGESRLCSAVEAWDVAHTEKPASYLLREVVQAPAADDIAIITIAFEQG